MSKRVESYNARILDRISEHDPPTIMDLFHECILGGHARFTVEKR